VDFILTVKFNLFIFYNMSVRSLTTKIIENMLERRVKAGGLRIGGLPIGGKKKKIYSEIGRASIKKKENKGRGFAIGGKKKKPKRAGLGIGGKKKKGVVPPALRKWHAHLMKVRKANPSLSLKEAMIKAKKSY
jgi:hypothetical protein